MLKICLEIQKNQLKCGDYFRVISGAAVDDDQQVIVGGFTFVKNIDLVKLWL